MRTAYPRQACELCPIIISYAHLNWARGIILSPALIFVWLTGQFMKLLPLKPTNDNCHQKKTTYLINQPIIKWSLSLPFNEIQVTCMLAADVRGLITVQLMKHWPWCIYLCMLWLIIWAADTVLPFGAFCNCHWLTQIRIQILSKSYIKHAIKMVVWVWGHTGGEMTVMLPAKFQLISIIDSGEDLFCLNRVTFPGGHLDWVITIIHSNFHPASARKPRLKFGFVPSEFQRTSCMNVQEFPHIKDMAISNGEFYHNICGPAPSCMWSYNFYIL